MGLNQGGAMRCSTLMAILVGVLLYLGLGALVFRTLEAPLESTQHKKLHDFREAFLQNNSCVSHKGLQVLIQVNTCVVVQLDVKQYGTFSPSHLWMTANKIVHYQHLGVIT